MGTDLEVTTEVVGEDSEVAVEATEVEVTEVRFTSQCFYCLDLLYLNFNICLIIQGASGEEAVTEVVVDSVVVEVEIEGAIEVGVVQ